jgi:hypothetical protein
VQLREFEGTERFQVLTRLGHGGMGTVYQVIDRARQTRVALKAVGHVTGDSLLRFKREFRALQEINHPNIIELGELFEQDGEWFFTMELITGTDFLEYVRPGSADALRASEEAGREGFFDDGLTTNEQPPLSRLADHPIARAGIGFNDGRIRRSLAQLAEALNVLHTHGHVHRDIKPSNVLVTPEGRVVIIDFGLVAGPRSPHLSTELHIAGTLGYMAPEQGAGVTGPTSDWYAMGALMYEALTGQLPLDGSGVQLLVRKQTEKPKRPRTLVPDIPDDLDALCMDLLEIDPEKRPKGRDILQRLHVDTSRLGRAPSTTSVGEKREEVVGREREMSVLEEEFRAALAGGQRVVTLIGESGLGKSALLRCFAQRIAREHDEAVVLLGRCYEQETVPFKALDAVMDQLSRWLKRLPAHRVGELLPEDVMLLARVFPVLQRVPSIAKARRSRGEVKDRQQRRIQVMRTLRAVFDGLSRSFPLIIMIDDFQWSDQDSLRMLAQLTGPPDPPPLLLVYATRHDEEQSGLSRGTVLRLSPLSSERSLELATSMAKQLGKISPAQIEAVSRQAEGYPFLIEALLNQVGDARFPESMDLDQRIASQARSLDEQAQRLVEVVCLAGFPITQQIAAEAAGLEPSEMGQRLRVLRLHKLIKTSGLLNTDTVEPYHDRIRIAIADSVPESRREGTHDALARALQGHHGEPQEIAHHLKAGAEPARAAGYLIAAADRAMEALAFDRAAAFYGEAHSVGDMPPDAVRKLLVARGHALASAGRGWQAAEVFAQAIAGSTATETLDLRRRIAEQLLVAGWYREGLDACDTFVEGLGISFPKHPKRVLFNYVWSDVVLFFRGFRHRIRERDQLSPHEISRVDAYWAIAKGLAPYDPIHAQLFHTRGLLAALKAGEPYRLARALGLSALTIIVMQPKRRARADARLDTAEALAKRAGHPHGIAFVSMMRAMLDYIGHCRWKRAADNLGLVMTQLRAHCDDVAWELDFCEQSERLCWFWLGEWKRLLGTAPDLCKEADDRGNRFLRVQTQLQWMSFAAALRGDMVSARRAIDDAIDLQNRGTSPIEKFLHLISHLRVDLYEGDGKKALARLDNFRPGLVERFTLKPTIMRTTYEAMAMAVLLAAAEANQGSERKLLFTRADHWAQRVVRPGVECTAPLAALARAAIRAEHGDSEGAIHQLRSAEDGFQAQSMLAHWAVSRRRRGQLMGGELGQTLVQEAQNWFASQGVANISAISAMLGPGFSRD